MRYPPSCRHLSSLGIEGRVHGNRKSAEGAHRCRKVKIERSGAKRRGPGTRFGEIDSKLKELRRKVSFLDSIIEERTHRARLYAEGSPLVRRGALGVSIAEADGDK